MNVDKLWHCSSSTTTKEYFCYPINKQFIYNSVSVEPSAPQPSPPMPSIRLRTCLTPCGQGLRSFRLHYAHSAPKSPRLTGGPQNDSGVRSAHEPTGNLQDCPDHTVRHIYRHSIIAGLQDTYQEPFPQAISSKTASPST